MKKICYIAGAGEFSESCMPIADDYLIAADAGLYHFNRIGFIPNIIVGDFDSSNSIPTGTNVIRFPIEKDDTDMAIAIDYALREDCDAIIINGGTGGRIDHTLANIQLLISVARKGKRAYLIDKGCIITAIFNDCIKFPKDAHGIVSVFCMDGVAKGVTEKNTKYILEKATLNSQTPLGVSNSIELNSDAVISVDDGCLVITFNADVRKMIELN